MTLDMQWWTMALMLLSGIGMGVVFDGYRVASNELRFPRWWLPFFDLIYWIAAALIVFRVLYASNNGEVRIYVFLGLAVGVTAYYFLFSRIVAASVRWSIRAIKLLIRGILRTLDWTVVKPLLLLYKLAKIILGFGAALTIFLLKVVLQLVRPFWLLLRWLLGPLIRPLGRRLAPYIEKLQLRTRVNATGSRIAKLWNQLFRRK